MELWAEVSPSRSRKKLSQLAGRLHGLADYIDVPDSPMGIPVAHALGVAGFLALRGLRVVANIRLADINANALLSLAGAARLLGVQGLVLLQGDPPVYGKHVGQVSTEYGVKLLRGWEGAEGLRLGVILSLARGDEELASRLSLPVDFVLATRLWEPGQLDRPPIREARRRGIRVIPYVVVAPENRVGELAKLLSGHQPVFTVEEMLDFVLGLRGLVDGVLVSSPLSHSLLVEALRRLREALGHRSRGTD
ncbi:hypothetical protein [Hyperthermus butylicus]|uniref:hypothetical protein n=1 Tax=Hyperthermus butylicus TaxID=54248 RepID=UPI00068E052C|nr:hypothetical protein [Hyperthermus butylicus]